MKLQRNEAERVPRHLLSGLQTGSYAELRDSAGRPVLVLVLGTERSQGPQPATYSAVIEAAGGEAQRGQPIEFGKRHVFEIY